STVPTILAPTTLATQETTMTDVVVVVVVTTETVESTMIVTVIGERGTATGTMTGTERGIENTGGMIGRGDTMTEIARGGT
ncbi:hypothetical protein PQX77_009618, partial [Marasmius sp. AFHP31]